MRVNRNYFGRQTESFQAPLELPFLRRKARSSGDAEREEMVPFNGIFIRAPVVEEILPVVLGEQKDESLLSDTVVAPSKDAQNDGAADQNLRPVRVMAALPGRSRTLKAKIETLGLDEEIGDIVAVKQGNVFGTSFHPELTEDARIHVWWLEQVRDSIRNKMSRVCKEMSV